MTPSPGILDASAQRLIDLGLSGVALLALGWFLWQLWKARESDREKADARYETVQEKRVAEQVTALDAVSKAVDTIEATIDRLERSRQP